MLRRLAIVAIAVVAGAGTLQASSGAARVPCADRLLVLSAYPAEIDKLLTSARIRQVVVDDGRPFYVGKLRGNDVVIALTGIGLVNAERTTRAALERFGCDGRGIVGIVFSGVAGGRSFIGDVTIPSRWTFDDGETWFQVDPEMFSVALQAISSGPVGLERRVPSGDPACVGVNPRLVRTISMPRAPRIITGGDGKSADPFGGRAFPCVPGGGNVFGCDPCRAPGPPVAPDISRFLRDAGPFVDPGFFLGYFESPTPSTTDWDAEDMETAAVARVASETGIPFLAFRAMSDGRGDPLRLPGFPFQFFFYHQLAADNAATVALAFLSAWSSR